MYHLNLVKAIIATTMLVTALIQPSFVVPNLKILGANYAGSGCPRNSTRVKFSPNSQILNIQTSRYSAYGNKPQQSRKSCNLTIPIQIPPGYQIAIRTANYQGQIASGTVGNFRAEYFFAGKRGAVFSHTLGRGSYQIQDNLSKKTNIWSRCGDSVNMRVNTSIIAKGQGMAKVDRISLNFAWRRCK